MNKRMLIVCTVFALISSCKNYLNFKPDIKKVRGFYNKELIRNYNSNNSVLKSTSNIAGKQPQFTDIKNNKKWRSKRKKEKEDDDDNKIKRELKNAIEKLHKILKNMEDGIDSTNKDNIRDKNWRFYI